MIVKISSRNPLKILFAGELFSKLSEENQNIIIEGMKDLLSQQPERSADDE